MNNLNAKELLDKCDSKLSRMKIIVDGLGHTSNVVPFFNEHAAVLASGAIEQAFKTIIADSFSSNPSPQLRNFIDKKIRDSSMNPSLDNIHNTLKSFDESWNDQLKDLINAHCNTAAVRSSFSSLVNARNTIAHGRDSTTTLDDIIGHFNNTKCVIEMIDNIVS